MWQVETEICYFVSEGVTDPAKQGEVGVHQIECIS